MELQSKTYYSQFSKSKTLMIARITILLYLLRTLGGDPYALHESILAYLLSPDDMLKYTFENLMANISAQNTDLFILQSRKPTISKLHSKCQMVNGAQSVGCLLPGLPDELALECLAIASRSNYPILSCVSRKFRSLISSGYLYKLRRKLGIQEHWIYISTSIMPWEGFDPSARRWMPMPRIPCDECFKLADKESLAVGTRLLVFGRETFELAIWMYNLVTEQWTRARPMLHGRCLFASASLNGIAYIAGGVDITGKVINSAEMYNSETDIWEPLPSLSVARKMTAGVFMDNKFYAIGGLTQNYETLTCGEEFNFETRVWHRIMNMCPFGVHVCQPPPLLAVVNSQLYAADKDISAVKKYNKENNTWHVVKELPVKASSTGWGMGFRGCGDRLILVMGQLLVFSHGVVIYTWCPDGDPDAAWDVLVTKEHASSFVQNCAIMGC